MRLRPYRLLKTVLVLVTVMAMTMIVGFSVVAGPTASHTSNGLMTTNTSGLSASELYYAHKGQGLIEVQQAHTTASTPQGASGDEPFYVILGVLDPGRVRRALQACPPASSSMPKGRRSP